MEFDLFIRLLNHAWSVGAGSWVFLYVVEEKDQELERVFYAIHLLLSDLTNLVDFRQDCCQMNSKSNPNIVNFCNPYLM